MSGGGGTLSLVVVDDDEEEDDDCPDDWSSSPAVSVVCRGVGEEDPKVVGGESNNGG